MEPGKSDTQPAINDNMDSANATIQSQEKEQKATIQSHENDNIEPGNATIWG